MLERLKFIYKEQSVGSENLWNPLYAQLARRWLGNEVGLSDTRAERRRMEKLIDTNNELVGPYSESVLASLLILGDSFKRIQKFLTHVSNLNLNDWQIESSLLPSLRIIRGYQASPLHMLGIVESLTGQQIDYGKIPNNEILEQLGNLEHRVTQQIQEPIISYEPEHNKANLQLQAPQRYQADYKTDIAGTEGFPPNPLRLMQEDPTGIKAIRSFMAMQDVLIQVNPQCLLPVAYGRVAAAFRYGSIIT